MSERVIATIQPEKKNCGTPGHLQLLAGRKCHGGRDSETGDRQAKESPRFLSLREYLAWLVHLGLVFCQTKQTKKIQTAETMKTLKPTITQQKL